MRLDVLAATCLISLFFRTCSADALASQVSDAWTKITCFPCINNTTKKEFDLFGPEPAPGTAPAASSATASANPFVSEEQASTSALQAGGSPTGVLEQVEALLLAVQV